MKLEHKRTTIQQGAVSDTGMLVGYANVTGVLDRAGEVVVRGAYKNLEGFVADGFMAVGHDWLGLPVGTIRDAREDDTGLWVEAEFHSTEDAQKARTVVAERLAAGKSVGLSIGYRVVADGYRDHEGQKVRHLDEVEVHEFSIVTVPANPQSMVSAVKGIGMPLAAQSEAVLELLEDYVTRCEEVDGLRKHGLSDERLEQLQRVVDAAHKLLPKPANVATVPDEELARLAAFARSL